MMKYWKQFSEKPGVFLHAYSVGAGLVHTLAVKTTSNQIMVISPPGNPIEEVFDEIQSQGTVTAVIAPNHFHHAGIAAWAQRFPDAGLFSGTCALARLRKKYKKLGREFSAITEIQETFGEKINIVEVPAINTGELLVRIYTEKGWVWFITDLICNLEEYPPQWFLRMFTKWMICPTGLHVNRFCRHVFMKDRSLISRWLQEGIDTYPPSILLTSHGVPIFEDASEKLREVICREL